MTFTLLVYCYHKYFCCVYADDTINVSVIRVLTLQFDKTFVIIMLLLITVLSEVEHI